MNKRLEQLRAYGAVLDARSFRERFLILITVLIVLVFACDQLMIEPLLVARKKSLNEISRVKKEIIQLRTEEAVVLQQAKVDPDLAVRAQIVQLDRTINDLDKKFKAKLVDLLSPQEMPKLLQQMLKQQKSLRLLTMENLPPKPVLTDIDGDKGIPLGIYKHSLDMKLEGSYLKLLAYLKSLEQMKQQVFWDVLSIDTQKYPSAKIHLQIHTLSLTEDWIGV